MSEIKRKFSWILFFYIFPPCNILTEWKWIKICQRFTDLKKKCHSICSLLQDSKFIEKMELYFKWISPFAFTAKLCTLLWYRVTRQYVELFMKSPGWSLEINKQRQSCKTMKYSRSGYPTQGTSSRCLMNVHGCDES